jgi:exonuclease III
MGTALRGKGYDVIFQMRKVLRLFLQAICSSLLAQAPRHLPYTSTGTRRGYNNTVWERFARKANVSVPQLRGFLYGTGADFYARRRAQLRDAIFDYVMTRVPTVHAKPLVPDADRDDGLPAFADPLRMVAEDDEASAPLTSNTGAFGLSPSSSLATLQTPDAAARFVHDQAKLQAEPVTPPRSVRTVASALAPEVGAEATANGALVALAGSAASAAETGSQPMTPINTPINFTGREQVELNTSERLHRYLSDVKDGAICCTVSTWNCKAGSKAHVNHDTHKAYIREVLDVLNSDVVCLQELLWEPKNFVTRTHETAGEHIDEYNRSYNVLANAGINSKEAVIYYDPDKVLITDWTNKLAFGDPHFALNGRFVAGLVEESVEEKFAMVNLTSKSAPAQLRIIVVSVHMPNKVDNRQKLVNAEAIIKKACDVAQNNKVPVVIGGDFNICLDRVVLPEGCALHLSETVDTFLHKGDILVTLDGSDIFRDKSADNWEHFGQANHRRLEASGKSVQELVDAFSVGGSHTPITVDVKVHPKRPTTEAKE